MEKDKKLVSLSMIILFFALIVVYSLLYQIKGQKLISLLSSPAQPIQLSWTVGASESLSLSETGSLEENPIYEWETLSDTAPWNDAVQGVSGWVQTASSEAHLSFEGESPTMLSGTDLYFGVVEGVELLGLEPDYLLKDKKGFYYAKFQELPELKKTVQDLGGNLYTMSSEAELLKNQLFGDRISFINLPEYKNKLVLMLLSLEGQHWLIQMDYTKYHHAKNYLKTLFIQ